MNRSKTTLKNTGLNKLLVAASVSLALFANGAIADGVATAKVDTKIENYQMPELASKDLEPDQKFRDTGQLVAWLLMQSHYQHPNFDNELSKEAYRQLVKMFDPNRSYFLASDLADFKAYEKKFDDAIRTGRIDLAYEFFELFENRHRERYNYALSLLEKPFDFKKDETFEFERRESSWFTNKTQLDNYWHSKVKNDALNLKLADQTDEQIKEKLQKRYRNNIRRLSQTTSEDVFGFFMNAVNASIDPHTNYYTPRQYEDFNINMSLKLQGIGAVLTQEDEFTKVVRIVNKGPAQRSGQIQKDDKIIGVAQGERGDMIDVIGWRNGDVVDLIRGEAGSVVRLQTIPHTSAGDGATKIVRIVREEIKLEDQAAKSDILEIEQQGKKLKYGVIELPSFYAESPSRSKRKDLTSTTKDVKRLIADLQKQNIEGLIIDLRNNGGGSLSEAVDLTGLFIDKGPVVQGKDYQGNIRVLRDNDGETYYNGPLAVMVNAGSASASEIFAGAIQDYGRGLVIGENTFGKGTVQTIADLNRYMRDPEANIGALKLTIEKFYRVTGNSTQNLGVKPDVSFPSFYDLDEYGEASYDNALEWDTIKTTEFENSHQLKKLLPYLQKAHTVRSAKDKLFTYMVDDVKRVKQERDKKKVSLNYQTRLAKREENNRLRLERTNFRRQLTGKTTFKDIEELEEFAEQEESQSLEQKGIDFENDILLYETANILGDMISIKKNPDIAKQISEQIPTIN